MPKAKPRSFRFDADINKQLALLAANLHITQTEVLEMGVRLLAGQFLPPSSLDGEPSSDNERLAQTYEDVAESYASDPHLNQSLKDTIYRVSMATAEQLRKEG